MKKILCTITFIIVISASMLFSDPLDDVVKAIGEPPKGKQVSIIWSVSQIIYGNVQMNHRESRYYEYVDNTDGDCKYLQLFYYPLEISGNAILSLEKEHKTYAYNAGCGLAEEIGYMPPEALFGFYIPDEYEIIHQKNLEEGSISVLVTDGELDYEYIIGSDNIPIRLLIYNHETSDLISKKEYKQFVYMKKHGEGFLVSPLLIGWYSIHPNNTYHLTLRDSLLTDFPDEIFSLDFLESYE